MKVGLIRCRQSGERCRASRCFQAMRHRTGAFRAVGEEIVCVGVDFCGGCPGTEAGARAKALLGLGAEAIVIATCISRGAANGLPCPYAGQLAAAIRQEVGESARVFEYSHNKPRKKREGAEKNCHERRE